uniref:Uncharacterized protein n=1 Tax=Arundo donax TaxID=35708 RepID=A0A0A8YGL6_ARUDO
MEQLIPQLMVPIQQSIQTKLYLQNHSRIPEKIPFCRDLRHKIAFKHGVASSSTMNVAISL